LKRLLSLIAIAILATSILPTYAFETKAEAQSIPEIEDPTPGYWETSEYMIGKVAVAIILPESNGSMEDWTDEEIQNVTSKIQYALDWWANQNPNTVNFITEYYLRIPVDDEPINLTESEFLMSVISKVLTYLGYRNVGWFYQTRDFANALREKFKTDWAFLIFVVDSSNDSDGLFRGGGCAGAERGGSSLYMTYDNNRLVWGIENMHRVCAHEIGHIFWASDEYTEKLIYSGYLNVSNIPRSGCLMDKNTLKLSGASHGLNGTWGQVGWRDSDSDGIQDIVDTPNLVYLNPYETIGNKLNFSGVATVTPHPNKNPNSNNPDAWHKEDDQWIYTPINVTINKIQSVQFRVDNGTWQNATITPWKFQKLVRYPDTYEYKETYAVVNFTFLTPELSPGEHFIEIKATNQWGNEGYANATVTIPAFLPTDLNKDGRVNILDIAIVAKAFGSHGPDIPNPGDPPSKNWNATADMDKNGWINIIDVATVARDYGKTT
jgi:hypothetical protein